MKKRKLRKKRIFLLCLFLIIITMLIISPFIFINIKLIGNKNVELDYGEKYSESGYKAYMFNKEISDDIKTTNNIKDKIGEYEVVYTYNFFIYNIKRIRNVKVSDLSGPKINLKGDKELSITIGTEYNEPGYDAIDELDGDLTDKVKVTNKVDTSKIGDYEVIYEVKDKAGNKTKEVRKVKVEKLKPYQLSLEEYSLDGWYDEVKLKETTNYGDAYFNKITMVGDSNTMNMYLNGFLTGIRAWAIPCLHADSMHSIDINLYGLGLQMKLLDAVEKYKPETMILNFGTFSTEWITEELFIEKANSMIEEIKKKSPDTNIILISIYPIKKGYNINSFKQEKINKFNFLILEMAYKHNLKYLDVQEVLKGPDGYGKEEYFVDDKFHFTYLGHSIAKEYIKTHALVEEE